MAVANQTVVLAKPQDNAEQAIITLEKFVTADRNYDDLAKRLRVYSEKSPNDSGLNDFDYPSFADDRLALPVLPELSLFKRVPLPSELLEQFARMKCNFMMGLFPEIRRAWLTIDNDVFVWNYENGGDLAYFDGLTEAILCCGLVKPKPGIFQPYISHLLVLTTPIEILLLGVTFADPKGQNVGCDPASSDMHLLPDPLYSLPSDNVHFVAIQGTESGRVLLGARDGCLYEIIYQAEDGWFSKKCRKVNLTNSSVLSMFSFTPSFLRKEEEELVQFALDSSRHILYTRSDKSTIQVYDLGDTGTEAKKVAELTERAIALTASQIVKTVDRSIFENIVHVAALDKQESSFIQLVAITSSGVRLYFAVRPFSDLQGRPTTLQLVHVRLPFGFSASANVDRPSNVRIAHHHRGCLLLVGSQSDEIDTLWTVSPDCFPFQPNLMESQMSMTVGGHTWALAEEPSDQVTWTREPGQYAIIKCNPPVVVTQHMENLRRFVLLSTQGSYIMSKLRPVDQLRNLLIGAQGHDSRDVEAFFKLHNPEQACATCLIIICSNMAVDTQVCGWATNAFFAYGGEPTFQIATTAATLGPNYSVVNQDITINASSPMRSFHPNQVSTPHPSSHLGYQGNQPSQQTAFSSTGATGFVFSAKHNGIFLYLGRILGPLWESKLVGEVLAEGGKVQLLESRVTVDELSWFIEQLDNLLAFLERNSQQNTSYVMDGLMRVSRTGIPNQLDEASRRRYQVEAMSREKQSLQQVTVLIMRCVEVMSLWKLVCENQFHIITAQLSEVQQKFIKGCTLKSLVSAGQEIFSELIGGIVQRYLGDNASTDAISSRLREVCPSLYSLDDAKVSKANEIVQTVKGTSTKGEKAALLQEAMRLYKEVAPNINLPTICEQLAAARHYEGILDLSLTTAAKLDPQNVALQYYRANEPVDDHQGHTVYLSRVECYNCVLETLGYLLNTSSVTSSTSQPGSEAKASRDSLPSDDAEYEAERLYQLILKSTDELLHMRLYDWMFSNKLTDKLLQISSPYLEGYLRRNAVTVSADRQVQALDILWRFLEKGRNFAGAAKILHQMAGMSSTDLKLNQRVEYLSRAVMSAKSANFRAGHGDGEFLHELEEKLEVARLQLYIMDTLSKVQPRTVRVQEALTRLDTSLMDITALYGQFADPFDLPECRLAIIHCAGHTDPVLVEQLWTEIIDKEFEACRGQSAETCMALLQNKFLQLARTYGTTTKFFPVGFIVKELEVKSVVSSFAESWVFETMLQTGISVLNLLSIYDRMYKAKDPYWQAHRKPHHVLFVICCMLDSYLRNEGTLSPSDRLKLVTSAQESISAYLIDLQSSTIGDPTSERLAGAFREIQAKLNRMRLK